MVGGGQQRPSPARAVAMGRSVGEWENDIRNTLHVEPEHRTIDFFQGIQHNNTAWADSTSFHHENFVFRYLGLRAAELPRAWRPRAWHRHTPLAVSDNGDGTWRYLSDQQAVRYTLRVHNDKRRLATTLGDPEAFVIYSGHARYGRGPCEGPGSWDYVGDDWQDGTATTGIFRMGVPFIGVPAYEILELDYHARLLTESRPLPDAAQCDADLRRVLERPGRIALMPLSEVQTRLARYRRTFGRDITTLVTGARPATRVWTYLASSHGQYVRHVIHDAGSSDLENTNVACRVFCHTGCSSGPLNGRVWLSRHAPAAPRDRGYTIWTSSVSEMYGAMYFLYHLLAYDRRSAGQRWDQWIAYARDKTNEDLRYDHKRYRYVMGRDLGP